MKLLLALCLAGIAIQAYLMYDLIQLSQPKPEVKQTSCAVEIAWPQKREAVVYVGEWK